MGRVRNAGSEGSHRAGPLKQTNKKHKTGQHKSKRALDVETRGRVSSEGSISKHRRKNHVLRSERKKQAAADRLKKMQNILDEKRNQGGPRGAPICVALIPLSSATNVNFTLQFILANCKNFADIVGQVENTTYIKLKNGKNITLVVPPVPNDLWSVLDVLKQADVSLFLQPLLEPVSPEGITLLKAAKEQGLATPFLGISSSFSKSDEKAFIKANSRYLPVDKIYEITNPGQVSNLLRMISVTKITIPKQWSVRSSMLIESYTPITSLSPSMFTPNAVNELTQENCTKLAKISGVIKRRHLNPHRPVYITGIGSFKILRIDVVPMQLGKRDMAVDPNVANVLPRFLYDPSKVPEEDVDKEVEDETMDSDSDIDEDDDGSSYVDDDETGSQMSIDSKNKGKGKKKLPKGTSDYQADWLIDSEEESEAEAELIGSDDELEGDDDNKSQMSQDDAEEDDDMDWEEEKKQIEIMKAARTEAEFPDWIDTPMDIPAKIRFQRYRGLQSFKKSPWDVNENLPKEYSKIFQFQNFRHVYKIVCGEKAETDGLGYVPVGQRVEMILKPLDASGSSVDSKIGSCKPISLVSLLRHETRMSVLNLQLNLQEVVKNKEDIIFQVGHHRFQAKPILSEVSTGNKHRMLRFAQENQSCMATVFAPIVFPHASVLAFKCVKSTLIPVGSGSLFSIDPSRVVVKRVLLSGHPFKVQGRNAVVRFMFFNREDIEWFKPVELRTRYGRRGHIKEPLGNKLFKLHLPQLIIFHNNFIFIASISILLYYAYMI
ncbi:unnamed protein product [Orchesella dallaii]|uniref:Pre-rRNA-processing protein TSR1 homolog n=1 Tax=Orchesella dallaii TaxID=48710 RepID=A0ABP1RBL1_9HEXA